LENNFEKVHIPNKIITPIKAVILINEASKMNIKNATKYRGDEYFFHLKKLLHARNVNPKEAVSGIKFAE